MSSSRVSHSRIQVLEKKNSLLLEPIGKSAPKFTSDSKRHDYFRELGSPTSLLCAAQGAPIPTTRLDSNEFSGRIQAANVRVFTMNKIH